jgi:hypothetical protein
MFNTDVATGKTAAAGYSTKGPNSAFTDSVVLAPNGPPSCYLWDILETCLPIQKQILGNGTAIVKDFILIGYKQADGTEVLYNGTSGGGNNNGSSSPDNSTSGGMSSIAASGAVWTCVLSAAGLAMLQNALF